MPINAFGEEYDEPQTITIPALTIDKRTAFVAGALLLGYLALVQAGVIPAARTQGQPVYLAPVATSEPALSIDDHSTNVCIGFQPQGCR